MFPMFNSLLGVVRNPSVVLNLTDTPHSVLGEYPTDASITGGFRLTSNGLFKTTRNILSTPVNADTDWCQSAAQVAGVGDLYECSFVKTGGTHNLSGVVSGNWNSLSSDVLATMTVSGGAGVKTWSGTLEVRKVSNPSDSVICNVSLSVTLILGG